MSLLDNKPRKNVDYKGLFQSVYKHLDGVSPNPSITKLSPHQLIEAFESYSEWAVNNPLKEANFIAKTGEIIEVPKPRAMTTKAFCLFAGISHNSFLAMEKNSEYKNICAAIRDCMYSQKFEYAAVNMMNSNFIAKDLGLVERMEIGNAELAKGVNELFPEEIDIEDAQIVDTKELPYAAD